MDCQRARDELHDLRRDSLSAERAAEVQEHLHGCADCRKEAEAEELLDRALLEKLPRYRASPGLRHRVEAMVARRAAPGGSPPRAAWVRRLLAPAAFAALAALSVALLVERQARTEGDGVERLAGELVTDHLRELTSVHPFDVESSVTHEVKPWFEGRLDFAPAVPGDEGDLRLLGGSVGYVLDRKAAVLSYGVRRHRVTLVAFPAVGLAWPASDREMGGVPVGTLRLRGFTVVLWRAGGLGYALVSDLGAEDGEKVAADLVASTAR